MPRGPAFRSSPILLLVTISKAVIPKHPHLCCYIQAMPRISLVGSFDCELSLIPEYRISGAVSREPVQNHNGQGNKALDTSSK
jgi:hypothetical protein